MVKLKRLRQKYKPKKVIIYSRDELKQSIMAQKFDAKKFEKIRFELLTHSIV